MGKGRWKLPGAPFQNLPAMYGQSQAQDSGFTFSLSLVGSSNWATTKTLLHAGSGLGLPLEPLADRLLVLQAG